MGRRIKPSARERLLRLGLEAEAIYFYDWEDQQRFKLNILRDLKFTDLEQLSSMFETKLINITECETGYYGDHDRSKIEVTASPEIIDRHFESISETKRINEEKGAADRKHRKEALIREAKRAGLGPEDLS